MSQRHPIQNEAMMLVTNVTKNRQPLFANPVFAREAIDCLYRAQMLRFFYLFGFVIMPDHTHFLLKVPEPGSISSIMRSYKSGLYIDLGLEAFWQPRFHIEIIDNSFAALNYIHQNPCRAGLAAEPEQYPWSSASGKWVVTPLDG